jgi:hypothetical protein
MHREKVTHQFMVAECEALEAMLVVHANAAREAVHMATEKEAPQNALRVAEDVAREASRVAEEAAREAAAAAAARKVACTEEVAAETAPRKVARVANKEAREAAVAAAAKEVVRTEEFAEEAAAEAVTRNEMDMDRVRWGKDMAAARRAHEIHDLANERCHRQRLAHHRARHARQTDVEGSNAGNAGWGDASM